MIFRFSAMGDVAMLVPVLRCLYAQNTNLTVTLVTRKRFVPIFKEFTALQIVTPDFANQQYKYCDTLRGDMPITQCRKRTTNFFFADIQDEESMLLVKNGEVANHTRIRVNHPKYKVFKLCR